MYSSPDYFYKITAWEKKCIHRCFHIRKLQGNLLLSDCWVPCTKWQNQGRTQCWICWLAAHGSTFLYSLPVCSFPGNALHVKEAHIDPPLIAGKGLSNLKDFNGWPLMFTALLIPCDSRLTAINRCIQSTLKIKCKKEILNWTASKLTTRMCRIHLFSHLLTFQSLLSLLFP